MVCIIFYNSGSIFSSSSSNITKLKLSVANGPACTSSSSYLTVTVFAFLSIFSLSLGATRFCFFGEAAYLLLLPFFIISFCLRFIEFSLSLCILDSFLVGSSSMTSSGLSFSGQSPFSPSKSILSTQSSLPELSSAPFSRCYRLSIFTKIYLYIYSDKLYANYNKPLK